MATSSWLAVSGMFYLLLFFTSSYYYLLHTVSAFQHQSRKPTAQGLDSSLSLQIIQPIIDQSIFIGHLNDHEKPVLPSLPPSLPPCLPYL